MSLASLAGRLARLTETVCVVLVLLLLGTVLIVVMLRFGFGVGHLMLQDLAGYAFAALVPLSLSVAVAHDRHVRVDVWREHQSPGMRHLIDRLGALLLLVPVFVLIMLWSWPDVRFAWSILEGARETGGLPGVYLLKTLLPLSCALVLVQGVLWLVQGVPEKTPDSSEAPDSPHSPDAS